MQRKITEKVETMRCPECEKKMTQVYGKALFDFKGYGWAKDNYGNKPPKEKNNEN